MIRRFYKLIVLFLIVGIALYLVLLNRETVSLAISPSNRISGNAGVIYIGLFGLGVLCTSLVALFFGLKAWLREKKLQQQDRQRRDFYQGMSQARASLCAGEWGKAAEEWQALLKKDPTCTIARIELSRCLEGAGDLKEALKILEAARTADPQNIEVLFRVAELHLSADNKTAALDNLALIIYHHPNRRALRMARDLSEELKRPSDALEYQSRLEALDPHGADTLAARGRLELARLEAEPLTEDELKPRLGSFVRQYPACIPAILKLARVEENAGDFEQAAQVLAKGGKAACSPELWLAAADLWARHKQPERALAAARVACRETRGLERLAAEINLTRLLLNLNMPEDAARTVEGIAKLANAEQVSIDAAMSRDLSLLRALCYNRNGEHAMTAEMLQSLLDTRK
jgi:tetratricopeptide (TPR) repeat protein